MANHTGCPASCHSHICEVCLQEYADHCECREFTAQMGRYLQKGDGFAAGVMLNNLVIEDVCPCCYGLCSERECGDTDPCEECGKPGTHMAVTMDICPTDRGDEVREFEEWVCNQCDPGASGARREL